MVFFGEHQTSCSYQLDARWCPSNLAPLHQEMAKEEEASEPRDQGRAESEWWVKIQPESWSRIRTFFRPSRKCRLKKIQQANFVRFNTLHLMGFTIHDGFHDGFHGDMLKNPRMMVPSVSYFGHTTSLYLYHFLGRTIVQHQMGI